MDNIETESDTVEVKESARDKGKMDNSSDDQKINASNKNQGKKGMSIYGFQCDVDLPTFNLDNIIQQRMQRIKENNYNLP